MTLTCPKCGGTDVEMIDDVEEPASPQVTTGTQMAAARKRARSELDELAAAGTEVADGN